MQDLSAERDEGSILLIEDDRELCLLMRDYFAQHGFRVETAADGRQGLARSLDAEFDLILLDVMLPIIDGFEVLRQLRKRKTTPVIMLTARTARSDRIAGLNTGADDYLPKPFEPEELLARIHAVLRRVGKPPVVSAEIESGGVRLNPATRQAWRLGEAIEMTSIEFDVLEVLLRAAGRTVSRDELAAAIYQRKATPYERSLDVHISHLRKKLEHDGRTPIRTIRGVGYQFAPGGGEES